jgi:hypothetical protein
VLPKRDLHSFRVHKIYIYSRWKYGAGRQDALECALLSYGMEMEDARGRTKHALGYLKALQAQNKFALACVKGQVNYKRVLIEVVL